MAEPDLTLPMFKLRGWAGDYLGWGLGSDMGEEAYSANKLTRLNEYVDTAIRMVCFEATIDPQNVPPHQWSFLTPDLLITVEQAKNTVRLPDDFGGFACEYLTVTQGTTGGIYSKCRLTASPYLDQLYAQTSQNTGRPMFAAERWLKDATQTTSTRSDLYIYPTADTAYTFRGAYNVIPDKLKSSLPFAPGGATMSEVYRAACRAAAELMQDNRRPGEGPEWQNYLRALAAAILRDGRHHPRTLGINRDMSDPSRRGGMRWAGDPYGMIGLVGNLTIDGVRPEE